MRGRILSLASLAFILLVLAVAVPVAAQDVPVPAQVGEREDAPPYALHGPYWVGYREFLIPKDPDNPIKAHLWYPALNPFGLSETFAYHVDLKIAAITEPLDLHTQGHALHNAAVNLADAPYPLIVFSHGFAVWSAFYAPVVEQWASHGFTVIGIEHHELFDDTYSAIPESAIKRPRDVTTALDFAEHLTGTGGEFEGWFDMDRIAVAGHSFGGYTSLAIAGARFDFAAMNMRCAAVPEDDVFAQGLCKPMVGNEAAMARLAGFDPVPEGLWPSFGDPRVDVIVSMAGDSFMFDQAGLAEITIPMMVLGGTADTGTLYDWGTGPSFEYASSAEKVRVTFLGGEHMISGASCEDSPDVVAIFGPWVCMDPVWDKARVHDLINHYTVAFLLAELKGDADARAALAPDAASFPGVEYSTVGF